MGNKLNKKRTQTFTCPSCKEFKGIKCTIELDKDGVHTLINKCCACEYQPDFDEMFKK